MRRGLSAVAVVELVVAMIAAVFSSHGARASSTVIRHPRSPVAIAAAPQPDSSAGNAAEPSAPATAGFYPVVQSSSAPAASAVSQVAAVRSASATSAPTPANAGNNWAVLIGISHYQGNTHPTYGGDGDVAVFQTLLQQAGWPSSHILVLTEGAATAANMRSAMNWLVSHSSPSSFTLFHYSGHVCEQGRGPCSGTHKYLWSVDNVLIPDTEFGHTMQGLQGWSWVDVAGCEAGAFDQGISSSQRLFTGSSQPSETSYEYPPWHESVWTGNLVDQGMLQRRAAQGSAPISIQQAANWANQQVQQMTTGQSTGVQHPVIRGGTGQWYLASPAPAQQGGQPAPAPPPSPKPSGGTPPTTAPNRCGALTFGILHC